MSFCPKLASFFVLAAIAVAGCAPSPEKVCKHAGDIMGGDDKPEQVKKQTDRCTEKLTSLKEKKPDLYKCVSECAMKADDKKALRECDKTCKNDD